MARTKGSVAKPITFDFSTVKVTDADMPPAQRRSVVDDTVFPKLYAESWIQNKAKQMILPSQDAAEQAVRLVRMAARRFGVKTSQRSGVRTFTEEPNADGTVVFRFLAVEQTERESNSDEAAADEPADPTVTEKPAAKSAPKKAK
jgi:hypothetical protein